MGLLYLRNTCIKLLTSLKNFKKQAVGTYLFNDPGVCIMTHIANSLQLDTHSQNLNPLQRLIA